jgi:hypothetical protein
MGALYDSSDEDYARYAGANLVRSTFVRLMGRWLMGLPVFN